jgi:hypothetical protein
VRLLDNFSSGNFPKALNLLYGIEDTENRQYVDLTLKMRNQAYEVSPTFAKLRPFLELPENKFWKQFPCLDSALSICDESANWFPWELREAIDKSGLAPSPKLFEELNGGIYEELATACFTKRIVCQSPGLAPSLDSLDSIPRYSIVDAMSLGFSNLLSTNLGQTDRTNGAKIEVDANVSQTWNQTIKGLPTNTARLRYESNDAILGDTRYLLSKLYSSIFVPLVLLAIFGVIKNLRRRANLGMLALSVASWVSVTVLVLQLSLLEASSGTYMRLGAENYLLPSIPFLLVFIGVGVQFMFDFFQQKADRPESGLETKQI